MDTEAGTIEQFDGFDAYYATEIAPELEKLEIERREASGRFKFCVGTGLAGLAVLMIVLLAIDEGSVTARLLARFGLVVVEQSLLANTLLLGGFAMFLGGFYLAYRIHGRVQGKIKQILLGKTCTFLGFDLATSDFSFPVGRFTDAGIIPGHRESTLEDRIAGTHGSVSFELCEAHLRKLDGGEKRTVFHGVLLVYSFPKTFDGRTVVVPDLSLVGNLVQGATRSGERVALEDPRFEEKFEVYSTDQIEARYLLTPRFMERLTKLSGLFNSPWALHAAFAGNDLLISIRVTKNMFESGGLMEPALARQRTDELLEELRMIFSIIEVLGLQDVSPR
jgi:hypothetical protein